MTVRITEMTEQAWTYDARAWVESEEIYQRTVVREYFWTEPLADMGRQGWELVSVTHESALMGSWIEGWPASTARPVTTNFFFKRPIVT